MKSPQSGHQGQWQFHGRMTSRTSQECEGNLHPQVKRLSNNTKCRYQRNYGTSIHESNALYGPVTQGLQLMCQPEQSCRLPRCLRCMKHKKYGRLYASKHFCVFTRFNFQTPVVNGRQSITYHIVLGRVDMKRQEENICGSLTLISVTLILEDSVLIVGACGLLHCGK